MSLLLILIWVCNLLLQADFIGTEVISILVAILSFFDVDPHIDTLENTQLE